MKAIEYFDKYDRFFTDKTVSEENTRKALSGLLSEMSDEALKLIETRHAKVDIGVAAVLKEKNQQWNAIVHMFEKKYGVSPLKRDGFKIFWIHQIPEYATLL